MTVALRIQGGSAIAVKLMRRSQTAATEAIRVFGGFSATWLPGNGLRFRHYRVDHGIVVFRRQ